ncbi:MAG: Arm DNA-binding domain-containing protein [Mangrovibacterium sp.]
MKQLTNTRVTVRLRKAEDRKEWYIYLESYPVYVPGKEKPQRVREYLNRSVRTVEWDKKCTARTNADGTKTYKPKRNDNGVIMYKSENDRETMLYTDSVRKLRQREYDNVDL